MSEKMNVLGGFEELVLLAIVNLGSDAYGVPIRRAIEGATEKDVSVGALYTTLERLEAKNYISSNQGDATSERGGRPKRYYKVESAGMSALEQAKKARLRVSGRPRRARGIA